MTMLPIPAVGEAGTGYATKMNAVVQQLRDYMLTEVDTWADLQEIEPDARRTCWVESQRMLYRADGIKWEILGKDRGYHYVDEHGATPGTRDNPSASDSFEAFRSAIIAASLNYDGSQRGAGIVIVGNGRYKVGDPLSWAEMGLNSEDGDGNRFGMFGVGGGFGSQSQIGAPISMIDFHNNAGFQLDVHLADSLSMRDLYMGSGGTVFTARDGAGALTRFDNVYASGGNATDPAVDMRGSFSVDWEGGALHAPTDAPASFMFGSDDVVEYSWYYRFKRVVVLGRGIVEQITDKPNSNGEGNAMVDCYSENFDLGGPMWKIECLDAEDVNMRFPDLERVYHSDRLAPADLLEISAVAGGSVNNAYGGGRFVNCGSPQGGEAHVRTTGAGIVSGAFSVDAMPFLTVVQEAAGGTITFNRQHGEYEIKGSQAANTMMKAGVLGEAAIRFLKTVDGTEYMGDGTVFPGVIRYPPSAGDPNGRLAGKKGSTMTRTDGGAGTTFYAKENDDGSAGGGTANWVGK